jgi:hypothetical protein
MSGTTETPGICTRMREVPWRVTTDSWIPVAGSSTRRRITSSACSIARSRTCACHSGVSVSV